MNFTREPIIETIITPKEGYKLLVRSSKASSGEEFAVDAVEVVSFGSALFFRSTERPRPFLIPVTDFEIVEAKETRVVLKNASFERSIKIGGGKEGSIKTPKEKAEEPEEVEQHLEKKRERRRHRRRRGAVQAEGETPSQALEGAVATKRRDAEDGTAISPLPLTQLIPPPPGLISETIAKTQEETSVSTEGDILPDSVAKEQTPKRTRKSKKVALKSKDPEARKKGEEPKVQQEAVNEKLDAEELPSSLPEEGGNVNRVSIYEEETATSTSFSSLDSFGKEPFTELW